MSDYMFMLESHLSTDQARILAVIQDAAAEAGLSLFLTGGAMRDMMGGFPVRDLDFTLEGNPAKMAKAIAQKAGGVVVATDDNRKTTELRFPAGVTASLGMARQELYSRAGAKPKVTPATIYEDLRGRDFTINSIGLSLNRASRGLLIDPTNGLSDLSTRVLRTVTNHTLYDDPARILRLLRLKARLSFDVDERTQSQYRNAREAGMEKHIGSHVVLEELRHIADEPQAGEILKTLADENLISLFSPALAGPKLNLAGFQKLQRIRQLVPFGVDLRVNNLALFMNLLIEKLSPKERAALVKTVGMPKEEVGVWQKLDVHAKKLEKELKSAKLQRPSRVYQVLIKAPGEEILYLLLKSAERLVQDRIKNYLQKYVLTAQEVTDADVAAKGLTPGTPKFDKAKREMILARLDARPKKIPPPEPAPEPPPVGRGRAPSAAGRFH